MEDSFQKMSSTLKGTAACDDEYNNSQMLYMLLKMRDLSDLNYLYNAQNVILLCEIMENRFQAMYNKTMYNQAQIQRFKEVSQTD